MSMITFATAYAIGEKALTIALKTTWIQDRLVTTRRRKIFEEEWRKFVDDCSAEYQENLFLVASMVSPSFTDQILSSLDGEWLPTEFLMEDAVWADIVAYFDKRGDEEINSENRRSTSLAISLQKNELREKVREHVIQNQSQFHEWYVKTVRGFVDRLYKAYQKKDGIDPSLDRTLWEFRKQREELIEIKNLNKIVILMIVVFASLSLSAAAFDLFTDNILNTPGVNQMFAIGGTGLFGAVKWAFDSVRKDRTAGN